MAFPTVHCDTAYDNQAEGLSLYQVNDFTELFRTPGQTGDLQLDEGIPFLRQPKLALLHLYDGAVPVIVLELELHRPGSFQFPYLAVNILLALIGAATSISEIHIHNLLGCPEKQLLK